MKPNKRKIREWRNEPPPGFKCLTQARCAACWHDATYTQFGLELCREHVAWCVVCNNLATKLSNDCDPYCPWHDPLADRGVMSQDRARYWARRIAQGEPCRVCLRRSTQVVVMRAERPEDNRISGWYCEEHKVKEGPK